MTGPSKQPPPLPPDDFVQRAVTLFGEKRFTESVRVCRLGLLADPRRLDGRLVLSRALMAIKKYEDVLAEVTAVLEQDPDNYRALLLKAEALVRLGSYVQAREVLMHVEDLDPFNHQASQLLDYLDDELERSGEPVARVTTDTRQYPSSKAREIKPTSETGVFLDQSTSEALAELSTRVGAEAEAEELAVAPAEGALDEGWEEEESTMMDVVPAFEEEFEEQEDTPLQETPTWDGEDGAEASALRASPTWEASITGEGPLLGPPTLEDEGVMEGWDGGGEVEGLESTVTGDGPLDGAGVGMKTGAGVSDQRWDGGGSVENLEPTVTGDEDEEEPVAGEPSWDGGGEVESMEPTVTGDDEPDNT